MDEGDGYGSGLDGEGGVEGVSIEETVSQVLDDILEASIPEMDGESRSSIERYVNNKKR